MKRSFRHFCPYFAWAFVLSIATLITANPFVPTMIGATLSDCELGKQVCQMACGCQKPEMSRKCSGCCAVPIPVESKPPLPNDAQRVWLDWQFVSATRPAFVTTNAAKQTLGAILTRQSSIEILTSAAPMCGASLLLQKVSWVI